MGVDEEGKEEEVGEAERTQQLLETRVAYSSKVSAEPSGAQVSPVAVRLLGISRKPALQCTSFSLISNPHVKLVKASHHACKHQVLQTALVRFPMLHQ